jgi:hypothetical protein
LPASSLPTRSCISRAALLVKVIAAMLLGTEAAGLDQVDNLFGDHPRLSRTGAGQDQQRTVEVADRFTLRKVEDGHRTSLRTSRILDA